MVADLLDRFEDKVFMSMKCLTLIVVNVTLSLPTISLKKFRAAVDAIKDPRDATLLKTAYLLAARNSEILTRTSSKEILSGASKPYGNFLDYRIANYEVSSATEKQEAVMENVLLLTCAVAKRGKRMKHIDDIEKEPLQLKEEEIIEAFTKFKRTDLIDDWRSGKVKVDPLLIKVLLGKLFLKAVALPCSPKFEPWTSDLLKWIQKHHKISFDMTRVSFWRILRSNLSSILTKKDKRNLRNPLRHFRISHLIEYYQMDPYEITSYTGWTIRSTFGQLGISASENLDAYAHLRWRQYFPKLLKSIDRFTK